MRNGEVRSLVSLVHPQAQGSLHSITIIYLSLSDRRERETNGSDSNLTPLVPLSLVPCGYLVWALTRPSFRTPRNTREQEEQR